MKNNHFPTAHTGSGTKAFPNQKNQGFTLVELLIIVAIIIVLAGISIAQYRTYIANAFDSRAQAVLREVATAEERYFIDNSVYTACDHTTCPARLGIGSIENGVTMEITIIPDGFIGTSSHNDGTGKIHVW